MRFCLVSTQEHFGGGEVLLASIADELIGSGHTVGWIVRERSQVAELLEYHRGQRLYACRHRGRNMRDLRAVRAAIESWSPDVMIMNDTHAVVLAGLATLCMGRGRPLRLAYKHTVFPLRSKLKYRLLTDKVICVSQAARETLIRGGMPAEGSVVVYGGTTPITPSSQFRDRVRLELGIPPETRLLVCVGNLLSCKGHRDLISALQRLDSRWSVLQVIAGEGGQRGSVEKQIKELGLQHRVRLLGFRHDADQLIQAADLIVHPSHAEGLSLVLIQAQMLRKPIVATAVGGAAEVLGTEDICHQSSWIAKPQNSVDLSNKIEQALQTLDDQQALQKIQPSLLHNAGRAKDVFSLSKNAHRLADVAADLL